MKRTGQPLPHESARGHVTGEALYTDDLLARFPRLLHAWPVLAPHAHAELTHLDASAALGAPGVVTVLTAADVPGEGDSGPIRHDEPIFPSEVMFHHQPVAWVLGETLEAARLGALAVVAEYRPLPAILTIEDAIAQGSFHSGPLRIRRGDAEAELARCAHRIEGEIHIGGQEHFYLETQATMAWLDESGGVSLHSSTQHPSETQEIVARVLGVPRHMVTVECLRMGGAFGGKEMQANCFAAIAALGARKTGRPVRVRFPRRLDMTLTGKRHPVPGTLRSGLRRRGPRAGRAHTPVLRWRLEPRPFRAVLGRAMFHVDNAYYVPALDVTGFVCKTHKTSQTAFRGFGGPQGMLVIEDILDRVARTLGLPPEVVRERNFYREGETTHYGQPVKDAARIERIWGTLKESSGFAARREQVDAFNAAHPHCRRGLAITPVKFGISFTATLFNQAGALVLIYRDGSVQVNHGGTEMGQGLYTKIRQIAADALGVQPEAIRVMPTRTDKVPNTSATAASAGTDLNGAAVLDACRKFATRWNRWRPACWSAIPRKCASKTATSSPSGRPERVLAFAAVVEAAYRQRLPLFAPGYYRTPEIHYDPKTGQGRPFYYFAYGAAVSEVEVDGFTGEYRLLRADLLEDVGESVSPLIDRGQIEGGFIQGVGWLTLEELVWDSEGRLATNGASTYKLPSWSEMPADFHVNFLTRAAEPGVIFGSKAVGEPPLMLAISVREAIRDAVASFGPGIVEMDSPCTPERVFFAVQRARAAFGITARRRWEPSIREPAHRAGDCSRDHSAHAAQSVSRTRCAGVLHRWRPAAGGRRNSSGGRVCGRAHGSPVVPVHDLRGGVVLPGFIDTHVHFPQLRIIGGLGCGLLDWLNRYALPEEVRMGEPDYARAVAGEFVNALASHGTTTALVFGSHFHDATAMLFEAAHAKGIRIVSGLVLSDRLLPEPLRKTAARGLRGEPRADRALPRARRTALRGDTALRSLGVGSHARGLPGADARFSGRRLSDPLEREHAGDRGRAARVSGGAELPLGIRPLRPGRPAFRLRAQRASHGMRTGSPGRRRFRGGALPVQQRGAGQRILPDEPAPGGRRPLRAGYGCRRGHRLRHAEGSAAMLSAATADAGGIRAGSGSSALPGDARRGGGAGDGGGDRRFHSRQVGRLRLSASARGQRAGRGAVAGGERGARAFGAAYAGRRGERARGPRARTGGAHVTLDAVNQMDRETFVATLGWVFEDSPWVAERAWARSPFAGVEALHQAMVEAVGEAAARRATGADPRASGPGHAGAHQPGFQRRTGASRPGPPHARGIPALAPPQLGLSR